VAVSVSTPRVWISAEAEFLAPPSLLQSYEDRRHHEWAQLRLDIAKADTQWMAEWKRLHPEYVAREEAFWAQKKAKRRERRAARREKMRRRRFIKAELVDPLTIDENDNWWEDLFLTLEESFEGSVNNDE
jgi:hypothetical protein